MELHDNDAGLVIGHAAGDGTSRADERPDRRNENDRSTECLGSRAGLQRIDPTAPNLPFTSERQEAGCRRLVAGVPAIAERGYDLKPLAL